jgi:potassium-dependent mechanosensitive channel
MTKLLLIVIEKAKVRKNMKIPVSQIKIFNFLRRIILSFLLIISCYFSFPLITLANVNTFAPVVLDGREIFQVKGSEQFSAQIRAQLITVQLETVVKSQNQPKLTIKEQNQLPVIWLNDNYLLTVTQGDTDQNSDPQTQAEIWKNLLQEAITQAQAERSSYFLWHTTFFSIVLVCLT